MKKVMMVVTFAIAIVAMNSLFARTFDFRSLGTKGSSTGRGTWWGSTEKSKSAWFQIKVGGATKIDDMSEIEIRAGTVFKNVKDKRTGVNDIAKFTFEPINKGKALFFMVSTGTAFSRTDRYWVDDRYDQGWQVAGCIIEIWQKGKVVKHWSNVPGNGGKAKLTDAVKCLHIDAKGYERNNEYSVFDNATEIYSVNKDGERVDIDEILAEFREESEAEVGTEDDVEDERTKNTVGGMVDPEEFKLKSFCGFVFGEQKPDLEQKVVKMQRPFRHYTIARPRYGENSGRLISVRLESQMRFEDQDARNEAVAGAASVIEQKYGISLQDSGSGYNFYNSHVTMWIQPTMIEVINRDFEKKEEILSRALREASKSQLKRTASDDGSDVL